jgi:hypothetical protein
MNDLTHECLFGGLFTEKFRKFHAHRGKQDLQRNYFWTSLNALRAGRI